MIHENPIPLSFERFNPTEEQKRLFSEAYKDSQARIAFLEQRIAEIKQAIIHVPSKNEQGQDVLTGTNDTLFRIMNKYRDELHVLRIINTNTYDCAQ